MRRQQKNGDGDGEEKQHQHAEGEIPHKRKRSSLIADKVWSSTLQQCRRPSPSYAEEKGGHEGEEARHGMHMAGFPFVTGDPPFAVVPSCS